MLKVSHRVGHALTTKGKESPDGVKEWSQATEIAKLVISELANYEGVAQKRFDDPTGKIDKPTGQLASEVNGWGAHVHIDYHLNAHGNGEDWTSGNGVETFVSESKPKEAFALATKVQNNIISATGMRNRGVKTYNWDMVYLTKMTAILVEMGFMTNKGDIAIIRSKEGQRKIAMAIVNALVAQYGLKKKYNKEEEDMLEKAVVYNSLADIGVAEHLANSLSTVTVSRTVASKVKVAKELLVVGGSKEGLKADKFTVLSGKDRFETAQKIGEFLKA